MKQLPSNVIALIESGRFATRALLRFDLDAGSTGVWSDTYTLTFGGVDYTPVGSLLKYSAIRGSVGLNVDRLEITGTLLSTALNTILTNNNWHQRPAVLSRAFLDAAGNVVHVEPKFSGFMDHISESDVRDGDSTATLTIESNARELNRAIGRTRSDSDQRTVDASDGFFRYVGAVAAKQEIYWGRKGPQNPFK